MLHQLGINETVFVQFVLYIVAFPLLHILVFKPFARAQEERQNRTKGSEQLSYEFHQKAAEIQAEYQRRVREVNGIIQEVFSQAKGEASREQEEILQAAKGEAQKISDENHKKIATLIAEASKDLQGQASQLSMAVTQKLLGKA